MTNLISYSLKTYLSDSTKHDPILWKSSEFSLDLKLVLLLESSIDYSFLNKLPPPHVGWNARYKKFGTVGVGTFSNQKS